MPHFFATAEDLLPVFDSVESKLELRYTQMGRHISREVASWHHGGELPTLRQLSPVDSAISGPAYLVTLYAAEVNLRQLPSFEGRKCWAVDQLENTESIVFSHGGQFSKSVLLCGKVATVSRSPVAMRLLSAYDSAIKRRFTRVKAFYVGEGAGVLLDSGVRLTGAAQSPLEYDLSRQ